jgi:hypothetical protein
MSCFNTFLTAEGCGKLSATLIDDVLTNILAEDCSSDDSGYCSGGGSDRGFEDCDMPYSAIVSRNMRNCTDYIAVRHFNVREKLIPAAVLVNNQTSVQAITMIIDKLLNKSVHPPWLFLVSLFSVFETLCIDEYYCPNIDCERYIADFNTHVTYPISDLFASTVDVWVLKHGGYVALSGHVMTYDCVQIVEQIFAEMHACLVEK